MKWVYQGLFTNLCGQACVAMVANKSLDEVVKDFGTKDVTNGRILMMYLTYYGIKTGSEDVIKYQGEKLPKLALLRLKWKGRRIGHWVIYNRGKVYDPSLGIKDFNYINQSGAIISHFCKLVRPR